MKPPDSHEELRWETTRPVRKPLRPSSAHMLGWTASFLLLLVCAGTPGHTRAGKDEYVRLPTPKLMTFDELVELEKTDEPSAELAARLDQLLHTTFLSNEAFYDGAKPNRPSSKTFGPPALRAQSENAKPSSTTPEQSQAKSSERIFGVVPTYTITDARNAPPLTHSQKLALFAKGSLDPFPFVVYSLQAGISQAQDTHGGYGQGAAGYGKRFGAALADGTSARFFGTYAFPSLLHQDPRYFRKGEGSARSRIGYSISRGFVTRADSGKTQPNWSNLLGKLTAGGLSNVYYPKEDSGAGLTFSRVVISLGYQTLGNLAIEFWPEIHRKFFGGKKNQRSSSPQ